MLCCREILETRYLTVWTVLESALVPVFMYYFGSYFQMMPVDGTKESDQSMEEILISTLGTSLLKNNFADTELEAAGMRPLFLPRVFSRYCRSAVCSPTQLQTDCRHNTHMPFLFLVGLMMPLHLPLCPHSLSVLQAAPEIIKY